MSSNATERLTSLGEDIKEVAKKVEDLKDENNKVSSQVGSLAAECKQANKAKAKEEGETKPRDPRTVTPLTFDVNKLEEASATSEHKQSSVPQLGELNTL